jgi:protein O-mannosyl-transferase
LHVESVAWLAERRDVLSGLFFLLALGAYTLYVERPSLSRYLAVAGCLALGLMSKSMLVTFPFLLLLLDYWPLGRFGAWRVRSSAAQTHQNVSGGELVLLGPTLPKNFWRLVVEKIPLMALSAASCAMELSTHMRMQPDAYFEPLSLATLLANALVSYAAYLGQSFYPVDLAVFYPHPGAHLQTASIAAALVLLVAITALAIYGWGRWPFLLVGWLWFLGTLVPVIGLVQNGAHARADRYTYLSQIGLSIALAWGVRSVYQSRQTLHRVRWRQWTLAGISAGAILLLAAVAWRQTTYWRNAETLFRHTLACTEQNAMAHCVLGSYYARQGRTEEAVDQFREALAEPSIDLQLIAMAHLTLAEALATLRQTDEALAHCEQAVSLFPANPIFHARAALAFARAGRHDRAIAEWRESVRLAPTALDARLGLADALLAGGENGEAIAQCNEILKLQPGAIDAIAILGAAVATDGQVEEAFPYLKRVLELDPRNARAHFHLGLALYGRGQLRSGVTHLNEAIQFQPDNVRMLWQTAWILATCSDPAVSDGARAVELAKRAIERSDGQELRALDALAAALAETQEFSAAVETAEHASTMALARGDAALADAIGQRTRLYRQGLPYRQPESQPPAAHGRPEESE